MEIERKFLVKKLPDLSKLTPLWYERYYLERRNGMEKRIQKKGDKFELEELQEKSDLSRTKSKKEITQEQYNQLKKTAGESIIRESYLIEGSPDISIKIYHDKFEGLIRAEVEFESEEEAKAFVPPEWFLVEITNSPLGRDSRLLDLSLIDFKKLLSDYI